MTASNDPFGSDAAAETQSGKRSMNRKRQRIEPRFSLIGFMLFCRMLVRSRADRLIQPPNDWQIRFCFGENLANGLFCRHRDFLVIGAFVLARKYLPQPMIKMLFHRVGELSKSLRVNHIAAR